jgi:hyperosmotically inducible periplasmic protein
MTKTLAALLIVGLAACGEEAPPKPAAKAPEAPPVAKPAPPPPPPVAKAEEPKPDPNKELAARVKRALETEAKIQAAGIDVTAQDGKVTLWGTTASNAERKRATAVAKKVEGVTAVDNQLKVVRGS